MPSRGIQIIPIHRRMPNNFRSALNLHHPSRDGGLLSDGDVLPKLLQNDSFPGQVTPPPYIGHTRSNLFSQLPYARSATAKRICRKQYKFKATRSVRIRGV